VSKIKLSENFIKNECLALDPRLHSIEEILKYVDLSVKSETKLYFTEDNFPKKNLLSKIVGLIILGDNKLKCVLSS